MKVEERTDSVGQGEAFDPVLLAVIANRFDAIVREMTNTLFRSGRSAVLIIKRLFGARVSLRAERLTYAVGFVFLIAFILWISGFDIARLGAAP